MRTALITGASRGIGRGIALELAGQGYGLTVTSRSAEDLEALSTTLSDAGAGEVAHRAADMADRDGVAAIADLHRDTFGTMDTLILNAGVGTAAPLETTPAHRVDKSLHVNFTSPLLLVQHALPMLRAAAAAAPRRGTRVIALSSITGVHSETGLAVYGASKAALISLVETLNAEESGRGVMATAIAPAFVDTDMAAWTSDTVPVDTMITVADVVTVVRMLLDLGHTTSITKIVMSRSGTTGFAA
jgi:3-oxoacyl-[acyl-carrier protein] reductase